MTLIGYTAHRVFCTIMNALAITVCSVSNETLVRTPGGLFPTSIGPRGDLRLNDPAAHKLPLNAKPLGDSKRRCSQRRVLTGLLIDQTHSTAFNSESIILGMALNLRDPNRSGIKPGALHMR